MLERYCHRGRHWESLATKLGLELAVPLSFEPEETRVRKLVDVLVGHYPQSVIT